MTYTLCAEMYHCVPSQLDAELLADVMPHLTCRSEQEKARKREADRK